MFKWRYIIITILSSMILSGCTNVKDMSLDDINTRISEHIEVGNMQVGDSKSLKRYFGLNSGDFEDVIIYNPSYTMNVEELLLVKVADEKQIDIVEEAIEYRVNRQIETFGSYGPEQCAMLDDYELVIADKYIFYVVSKNADDIAKVFKECIY